MWRSHIPHSLSCNSMYDLHRCWNQIHVHVYSTHNVCKQTMHLFILLLTSESINSLYQINCPVQTIHCSCVTVNCFNASVIKDIVLFNVLLRSDVFAQHVRGPSSCTHVCATAIYTYIFFYSTT